MPVPAENERHPFASPDKQTKLRQYAIQAFASVGQNLNLARQLFQPETDGPKITNSFLQCYLRQQKFQQAEELWDAIKEYKSSLDQQSYRLILQCGGEVGDVPLMERALQHLENITNKDKMLVLKYLLAAKAKLPPSGQAMAVTSFKHIVKKGRTLPEPELISELLVVLDQPRFLENGISNLPKV